MGYTSRSLSRRSVVFIVSLLVVFLTASIFLPTIREPAKRILCASNLRTIRAALEAYAASNGGFYPPDLTTLAAQSNDDRSMYVCLSSGDNVDRENPIVAGSSNCSYLYCYQPGLKKSDISDDRVILLEPLANHRLVGTNVNFGDGRTEWMDDVSARDLLAELLAGHNPPRLNHDR